MRCDVFPEPIRFSHLSPNSWPNSARKLSPNVKLRLPIIVEPTDPSDSKHFATTTDPTTTTVVGTPHEDYHKASHPVAVHALDSRVGKIGLHSGRTRQMMGKFVLVYA